MSIEEVYAYGSGGIIICHFVAQMSATSYQPGPEELCYLCADTVIC